MRRQTIIPIVFAASALLAQTVSWALQAPDFTVAQQKGPRGTELVATPPAGNHINIQAPMSLQKEGTSERIRPSSAQESKTVFTLPQGASGTYLMKLFLCDDKKTYCEAHQVKVPLSESASQVPAAPSQSPKTQAAPKKKSTSLKMNKEGFILNQPEEALALAAREKKPMLIDFYGIWCPPCNMLDEEIFTSAEFRKAASRFVKLKMDADSEISWKLKERYKIGGYPSVIFADSNGDEILRVVGYLRKPGFIAKVNEAWNARDLSKPDSARQGLIHLERREYEKAMTLLKDVPSRREEYASAEIGLWQERNSKNPSDSTTQELIAVLERSIQAHPQSPLSIDWRQQVAELYSEKQPEKKNAHLNGAIAAARDLIAHPERLDKYELTLGDTWSSLAQAQEALSPNPAATSSEAKESWLKAAEAYGKFATSPRERGNNLERAYCLRKAGEYAQAEAIYRKLEKFYPEEFTFYNAHAAMELERKNLALAEELARKAFQYSYGNNKLRTSLLLAKVHHASGKKADGIAVIEKILKEYQVPESEMPRAQRTIKALKELLAKLQAK